MLRRIATALALSLVAAPSLADSPLSLRGMGSFHVGGRVMDIAGKPVREIVRVPGGPPAKHDPNGQYAVEQMYVQYFLPQSRKGKTPLLMWHGGGLTGASFETTPDGREGWLTFFVRKGWDTYLSDAVERGRSGFASADVWTGEPIFLTYSDPFERFRIGEGPGSWHADPAKRKVLPGNQFPVEAYESFMRQAVPRWLGTDAAVIAGYSALVDKVCPCVLLAHSQGAMFAMRVAEARPDKIRAIVAVEPAGSANVAKAAELKAVPMLLVWGDFFDKAPRWEVFRKNSLEYAAAVRAAGGTVDVVNLPEIGIKGNSHMLIMDKNNAEVAEVIQKWLAGKGLVDP